MKIRLGRRGDYAVRAALHLARAHGDARRKAREIAVAMDVPVSYLPQILGDLVRAGIVSSAAGPEGGYELAREPGDVSLLDVVLAVDEGPRQTECVLSGGPCRWETACAVHAPWVRAQEALMAEMAATTFAVLADEDARLERLEQIERLDERVDGG
jgi:Rrf2 family transcriptional regulator, iron-sulfur cluster assembly transcription factor